MNQPVRILLCLFVATVIIIIYYPINENVLGQQEQQPTNNTDNLETMIQQNDRIIEQNDETAIQDRAGTFIGTIALLVSLSLVIYGFQLSHRGKITRKTKRHYQIIVLSLIGPVIILITVASFGWGIHNEFLYPHYNIMVSLLLIPAILVIILMFRGSIVGSDDRLIRLTLKINDAKKTLRAALKKSVLAIIGLFDIFSIFIQLPIANTRIQIAMQSLSYHQLGGSKTYLYVLNCGNIFRME